MNRQVNATAAILLGLLAGAAYQGRAADDVPTHKTLFFNTYYPKAGQSGMNVNPGDVRTAAGTLYEGWWREESYWRSNPTNGFGVHGFNMKSKVYGDKAMQWTQGIATNMNSPRGYTPLTPSKGRSLPDFSGEPNREDMGVPPKHPGQLHGGKGSLRDQVWTSGERFTDQMTVLSDFTNSPPNGEWDGVLLDEDYWNADNTNRLVAFTDLRRSLVTYPTPPKDWDYLRGEYYADYNNDTRVNNATTRVVNVGFQTNLLIWVADTRVGHGTNIPVRISEQTVEIPDLTTLVPSSFVITVTNAPVVSFSNTWVDTSVTYPSNHVFTFTNTVPIFIQGLGWIYEQIVSTTSFPFNITIPSSNLVVVAFTNDPMVNTYTNYLIVLNADTNGLFAQGDFAHTLVQGNADSGNVSEPRNQLFDYDCDQAFNPIVYPAFQNGLTGVNETNRAYVVYQSYLWIVPATPYLTGNSIPPDAYYQIPNTSSGNPAANPGLPPSYQNDFGTTNVTTAPYNAQIRLCKIYVPIYQAGELWGRFLATNGSTVVYWDDTRSFTSAITGQVTEYPPDNRWTPGHDHETYEDFLSWWVPSASAWVDGVVGVNTNGVIHEGPSPVSAHLIRRNAIYPITYQEYTNYIYKNYPGDCVSLVKRCGNGIYDGPDMWTDMGTADENKMQQRGFLSQVGTPEPGTYGVSGWDHDSYGNTVYGGTFGGWWQAHYAATSVGSPSWESLIPNVITWPGIATDAYVSVVSTTMVQNVPVLVYSSVIYPPIGSTWGYKSPREFDDLPSAIYHSAGDGRLGESTCPWDWSIFGADKGVDNPAIRNMNGADGAIPAAGPMAYDIHATEGLDAGNQVTIEWLTWRTDGQYLTGPKGGGVGSGPIGPPYTRDHRDVNLDGLIDLGETVPPRSANYAVDTFPRNPTGGRRTSYPYNWQRYFEDCVEAWDTTEDFNALLHNNSNGSLTQEIRLQAPSTFTWPNGIVSTNSYLTNVCYRLNPNPPHTGFDPAIDDMWLDANGDTNYNSELVLNNASGLLSFGTPGTSFPTNRVKYIDIDNNTAFTPALDFAWYDANNNGSNDTDLVLSDSQYTTTNRLTNGALGVRFNTRFDVGVSDSEKVYYQECDGIPGPSMGDNFWLENRYTNTTTVAAYDNNGSDIILYIGTTGDGILTNGTPGVYLPGACYQALNRYGPGSDVGWLPGDNVWIDTMAGGSAGIFDCEDAVHAPYGLSLVNYPFPYRARVFSLLTTGTSLKLNRVCYVNRPGGTVNYERKYDDVWLDSDGNNIYNQEYVICNNGGLVDGTPGIRMPNVAWLDMDGNGVYTPITAVTDGEAEYTVGDVLWYDYNGNHAYDLGDSYTIPLYFMGWGNPEGTFDAGPHTAGFLYGVRTRDGVGLGGFGHVWPASVAGFASPTHEQGHELVGWPDYYDYNISDPDVKHSPIGSYDLMAVGGLVHGIGSTKLSSGWVTPQYLNGIAIGGGAASSPAVLRGPNAGRQTVLMYPIERMPDQYFTFVNPALPSEGFNFWYASGQSVYSVFGGTPGVVIEHFDGGNALGHPLQQRANYRYRSAIVQADGLYQMEDGVNGGDSGDLWGPTKKVFNEYSIPPARWWSQAEAGVRILDIRLPANPLDPAEVDFEWVATTNQWFWVGPQGAGAAGSSAAGGGGTNAAATNAASATPSVAFPSVPGVGAGIAGGFFGVRAGGNRGDSDFDGLPDAWEIYWFGHYANPLTYMNATTDYDHDGLPDYAEWLAHLNPMYPWSWINQPTNITDADADIDGDGIGNLDEYEMGLNMREPDSDDDGWNDSEELNPNLLKADQTGPNGFRRITSPVYSRSPLIERSVHLTAADRLTIPSWEINDYTRFMVTNWTVEAWVKLDSSNETGTIVQRITPQGATTFEIGIRSNRPYAAFSTEGLNVYRVEIPSGNAPLASNTWTHIAGVFDQPHGALSLYLDGVIVLSMTALESPATGHPTLLSGLNQTGTVRLGGGFNGFVDEVRIWGSPRTADQIALEYNTIINSPWVPGFVVSGGALVAVTNLVNSTGNDGTLISNLRFDDGQNLTITNKLDGTVHSAGIEDWVHPLGPNEGVYWNRLPDNGVSYGYCLRLSGGATLTTNADDVMYLKLSSVQPSPIDDLNEDGIPDWWQELYWPNFDPTQSGPWDPAADPDNDHLSNLWEYLLDKNPTSSDTGNTGVIDGLKDDDGDGLSNEDEILIGTDPRNPDTDDDGISDGDEINPLSLKPDGRMITSPLDSRSPLIQRSYWMLGTNSVVVPDSTPAHPARFDFGPVTQSNAAWTLECWVKPASASETGNLIVRRTTTGGTNFALRLENNVPSVLFNTGAGGTVRAGGVGVVAPLPANVWTHLAGIFDHNNRTLALIVNHSPARFAQVTLETCVQGNATTLLGEGVRGLLDDVRIWSEGRPGFSAPAPTYSQAYMVTNSSPTGVVVSVVSSNVIPSSLVAWYLFDDGENTTITNKYDGLIHRYGAEDTAHPLNWDYSIRGVLFTINTDYVNAFEFDVDNNGLADWWEMLFFGALGNASNADPDGDGLPNAVEYALGTNPLDSDTNNDGIPDGDKDADGDGISNADEILFGTDPLNWDTDDDGISDGDEVNPLILKPDGRSITSPTWGFSPFVRRSLMLDGNPIAAAVPPNSSVADRYNLNAWTIECWVKTTNGVQTGTLLQRVVTATGRTNYAIRLDANVVSALFQTASTPTGHTCRVTSPFALATNAWNHIAATWSPEQNNLALYVNGVSVQSQMSIEECATGPGTTTIGSGVQGWMDEMRVWNIVRTPGELAYWMDKNVLDRSLDPGFTYGLATSTNTPGGGGSTNTTGALAVTPTGNAQTLWSAFLSQPVPPGVSGLTYTYVGAPVAAGTYVNASIYPSGNVQPMNGIVLSSGTAAGAGVATNTTSAYTGNNNLPGDPDLTAVAETQTYDATILTIQFTSDASVNGVSFDLFFASEEFPEYVGAFNDVFIATIDGKNIALDASGNPLSVNNNYFQYDNDPWNPADPDSVGKIQVTLPFEFDGLTPLLQANAKISAGVHTLKLAIADAGDSILDSVAFLSNFKFSASGAEGLQLATGGQKGFFEDTTTAAISNKALVAYYTFDDGGKTIEDLIHPQDKAYAILGAVTTNDYANVLGEVDSNGNRIPDWWETLFFGAIGVDPQGDPDGDDLNNLYEYLCGSNPLADNSDGDAVLDADEDLDGDGLINLYEQMAGTDPRLTDTDDDGIPDALDPAPANPLIPLKDRALSLDGTAGAVAEYPVGMRFKLPSWTIEAWVKPAVLGAWTISSRSCETGGVFNWYLRTTADGRVVTGFTPGDRTADVTVQTSPNVLAVGRWTHVLGRFDADHGVLAIEIDGLLVNDVATNKRPATNGGGPDRTVLGPFNGWIDEARIWSVAPVNALGDPMFAPVTGMESNLVSYLRFDDGTSFVSGTSTGTSGRAGWTTGQIQDFAQANDDWLTGWRYAVTLRGTATMSLLADPLAPTAFSVLDSDGDGMPDWWEQLYGLNPYNANDAEMDADGDGLSNLYEYLAGTDPRRVNTGNTLLNDSYKDSDGDGVSNGDEQHLFLTNPGNPDTDDDGIPDGEELCKTSVSQEHKLAYGVQNVVSGPTDSLSPWIPRSMVLGLPNSPAGMLAPHSERFTFVTTTAVGGPVVKITVPTNGASIAVRYTAVKGSVASVMPLDYVRLYNNGFYITDLPLTGSNFNYTAIIRSGANELTVVAVDTEGLFGVDKVTVNGAFAPADIRVTQEWDNPGDLDTWVIDPFGRHMGWTLGGPGYPANAGPGRRIPGAFLDIDDIPGVGPENITIQQGSATTGIYNVWMDNFANSSSPNSRVHVLIHEGQPGEKYVAFGPQSMPVSDGNGSNPQAWWHTTDITWPDGTMNPPGTPVSGTSNQTLDDEGIGFSSSKGWTIEAWIKAGDANQSGAIARYRMNSGDDAFVVGLSNNCPYMMVRSGVGAKYELLANPLATNEWVHLAFVCAEGRKSIRIHENGALVCARLMLDARNATRGWMYVDAPLALTASTNRFTNAKLDELRFWNLARSGGLINKNMHALFVEESASLVAGYHFDDGGLGIEDMKHRTERTYDLGGFPLPDLLIDPKPGADGIWGTADDIPAGVGSDGQNDFVTATDWAPVYGIRDANNNGLPDWFEKVYGVTDPYADPDGDGLDNLHEYWCGTNPLESQTYGGGISDGDRDFDGDGLINAQEQIAGTDPRLPDTDDDGVNDALETRFGLDGADSLNPARDRSLAVDGTPTSYVRAPASTRFALAGFDISAWVYMTNVTAGAEIVARQVEPGRFNYVLGIDGYRIPYVSFRSSDNVTNVIVSAPVFNGALPLNEWRYLRAIFDDKTGRLELYIGSANERPALAASTITEKLPKRDGLGPIEVRIGKGFAGLIDDVLIKGAPDTVLDYRFDDGTAANGVSGMRNRLGWKSGGQVEDFSVPAGDWLNHWLNAGTLLGNARFYDNFGAEDPEPVLDLYLDSDGDGLPDWWEIARGLNPYKADSFGDGVWDGDRDMDHDGLSNLYEYLANTDPWNPETTPGIPDGSIVNLPGDLTNLQKQEYRLDPLRADTDDDGIPDVVEVMGTDPNHPGWFTLPNASLSPARSGALQITGAGQYLQMPAQSRLAIDGSWTIEAWVNISNAFSGTGTVIQRAIGTTVNYELGFTNGVPIARMVGTYRGTLYPFTASGTALARRNQWYHLAAVYDEASAELRLLVDGSIVGRAAVTPKPATSSDGTGSLIARVGDRFIGLIDEVRIWKQALTNTNIAHNAFQTFETVPNGPVLYYRFDDGPFNAGTTTNRFGLAINTVEDFAAEPADWMQNWRHAGVLKGGAVMALATTPIPATQFVDADADDLPDFWEIAVFGSISTCSGKDDPDGDGLNNFYEYRAHLNPIEPRTFGLFGDNTPDGDRDSDNDGLINRVEQELGTLPDQADTDDDGKTDGAEVTGIDAFGNHVGRSDPLNSLNPLKPKSLALNGNSRMVVPAQARHAMADAWTIAAWVWPSNNASGIVVGRLMADNTANYELGVTNNGGILSPYARYSGKIGNGVQDIVVAVGQPQVTFYNATNRFMTIAPQSWTHLAASYQAVSNRLSLFVDGELVAYRTDATLLPVTGAGPGLPLGGELAIGGGRKTPDGTAVAGGFEGYIDDVRLAAKAYGAAEIRQMARGQLVVVGGPSTNTVASGTMTQLSANTPASISKPDELIVCLRPGVDKTVMSDALNVSGLQVMHKYTIIPAFHVKITDGSSVTDKIAALKQDKRIAYAEPNFTRHFVDTLPNDTRFAQQWGLNNTVNTNADINAPVAWDVSTGSRDIVVAVIDSGVDYNHEDLKDNMWRNPGEIPGNGIDDDGNGYIDDVYGYDFGAGDSDPMDDVVGHGTHCAGIIGATGNNALGVCGVNWKVKLMACKIADAGGNLVSSVIIEALDYAWKMGARVSNNSYGGLGFSQAEYDAVKKAGDNNHLFVAAAGNNGTDNDSLPFYPASFDLDNVVAVAATDNTDGLASFSCYGLQSVDLGAPGVNIMSTLPTNGSQMGQSYGNASGTSMACPHVVGAAALILSVDSGLSYGALKAAILNNVDPIPSLAGKTVTGGRLNIGNILPNMGGGGGGGAVIRNGLVGWFKFWDGGRTAQDFTRAADWMDDWRFAGALDGAVVTNDSPDHVYLPTGDSDGDGLPDWWEEAMGLDPFDATGDNGADGDPDGDGLTNLYEYLAGTDPLQWDSDASGVSDFDKDSDGDGISNGNEQDVTFTDPGDANTDDDDVAGGINGLTAHDGEELTAGTRPADSLSPFTLRALEFQGSLVPGENVVTVKDKVNGFFTSRHSMSEWTIQAYVNPYALSAGVYPLISRSTFADNRKNYELGIANGVPYVAFDSYLTGTNVVLSMPASQTLGLNEWVHLTGRFTKSENGLDNELALFVNGVKVAARHVGWMPAVGPGDVTFGSPGFRGMLNNIRLWKIPQADEMIAGTRNNTLLYGNADSMAGRLLVTGDQGHLKETATTLQANGEYVDMLRQNWTLECWVKTRAGGGRLILRRNQAARTEDDFNYYLGITPGGTLIGRFAMDYTYVVMTPAGPALVYVRDYTLNNMTGEIPVNDGNWHHVAYVRSDNGCALYVDGLLDASQKRTVWPANIPPASYVVLPAVYAQPGPCIFGEDLAGEMDEIRIWNRALPTAELKDVASRNLGGTERGLITYFNFDFQLGKTADERAVIRDPAVEYGIYIPNASNLQGGSAGGAPISYDPLLSVQRVALMGMFPCADGGVTVEDLIYRMGNAPFNFGAYAGCRGAGVVFRDLTAANYPFSVDSDNDGLPDWWEVKYGLDPSDPSGVNGPYGDPDGDGLDNAAEYLAGTDPRNSNTPGSEGYELGYSDFYHRANTNSLSYGELYTAMDSLPSLWKFNHGLDPNAYEAENDPDHDGWSNYAEYMAGSNPQDQTSVPRPPLNVTLWYAGTPPAADLKIESYTVSAMDGTPDARFTYTLAATNRYPVSFNLVGVTNVTGWLREGTNWFFAYVDRNGNNQWDVGEPCGTAMYQPLNLTWGTLALDLNVSDKAPGFPRFQWTLPAGVAQTRVQVDYVYMAGSYTNYATVVDTTLVAPRSCLTEADVIRSGLPKGLGTPSQSGIWQPVYRWSAQFDPPGGSTTYVPSTPYVFFTQTWFSVVVNKPIVVHPLNETVQTLPLALEWKATDQTAAFLLEIRRNSTSGTVWFNSTVRPPSIAANAGLVSYVFQPQYEQATYRALADGEYWWRVKTDNNPTLGTPVWSDWTRFIVDSVGAYQPTGSAASVTGPFSITGDLEYFGKVANHAEDQLIQTNWVSRTNLNITLPPGKTVTAGTLTLMLRQPGVFPDLVTFSDAGVTITNLANQTLRADVARSQSAWTTSVCRVNYNTGVILSMIFPSVPTNAVLLGRYDYLGDYPFVIQAYRTLSVPGFSGHPVAQISLNKKGPFTIAGLRSDSYTLLGFLDQFGSARLMTPESWGFVRNLVPQSGPGYVEIHPLTVGPSIPTNAGVRLTIRDRDTDNDKLPDAWELLKFGSISQYSGADVVIAGDLNLWDKYARGALDDDPFATDSDYDGLSDVLEKLFGTSSHNPSSLGNGVPDLVAYLNGDKTGSSVFTIGMAMNVNSVAGLSMATASQAAAKTGGADAPTITWQSPAIASDGAGIQYIVERADTLANGGNWAPIPGGTVIAWPGEAAQTRVFVDTERKESGFYRVTRQLLGK